MRFGPGLYRHIQACNAIAPGERPPLVAGGRAIAWPSTLARGEMASLPEAFVDVGDHWEFAPDCGEGLRRLYSLSIGLPSLV